MSNEDRLTASGLVLPTPAIPIANYVPAVRCGSLLLISGQLAFAADGKLHPEHKGKLGLDVSDEAGFAAARLCGLNVLAQARIFLGSLNKIVRCIRLGGFINSSPDYERHAAIMNGASDLMVEILGDAGCHARTTIGVAQLPLSSAVEVEAMFEVH